MVHILYTRCGVKYWARRLDFDIYLFLCVQSQLKTEIYNVYNVHIISPNNTNIVE